MNTSRRGCLTAAATTQQPPPTADQTIKNADCTANTAREGSSDANQTDYGTCVHTTSTYNLHPFTLLAYNTELPFYTRSTVDACFNLADTRPDV